MNVYRLPIVTFLFLLAVIATSPAQLLNLGVTAGVDLPRGERTDGEFITELHTNIVYGGFAELILASPFSLRFEAQYAQKEASVRASGVSTDAGERDVYSLNLMEFPVDMRLNFGSTTFRGFASVGTTVGTLLEAARRSDDHGRQPVGRSAMSSNGPHSVDEHFEHEMFQPVSLTLDLGIGASYAIARNFYLSAEVRRLFSPSDDSQSPITDPASWVPQSTKVMTGMYYSF